MSKLKTGARVSFVRDGRTLEGIIKDLYFDLGIAVVVVGEKLLYKVDFEKLVVISEKTDDSTAITITPEEFQRVVDDVIISTLTDSDVGRLLLVFSDVLKQNLFGKSQAE